MDNLSYCISQRCRKKAKPSKSNEIIKQKSEQKVSKDRSRIKSRNKPEEESRTFSLRINEEGETLSKVIAENQQGTPISGPPDAHTNLNNQDSRLNRLWKFLLEMQHKKESVFMFQFTEVPIFVTEEAN